MRITDIPIGTLDDEATPLSELAGKALLIVNVASKCGFTPQYAALEELHQRYAEHGFSVVGVPCNQFGGQEPGTEQEIREFCTTTYGVTFPLTEKVDVNGDDRHPLYAHLIEAADADGQGQGQDIRWNFEKFLVSADGETVQRFSTKVAPDDPELVAAIEAVLVVDQTAN